MSHTLSRRMKAVLRNGLDTVRKERVSILSKWDLLLTQIRQEHERIATELEALIVFFTIWLFSEEKDVDQLFTNLHKSWNQLSMTVQPNRLIFNITMLENTIHEVIKTRGTYSYQEHQAIQYLFSKVSEELLQGPSSNELNMVNFLEQLVFSKQLPINWIAILVKDNDDFRIEKVISSSERHLPPTIHGQHPTGTLFSLSESLLGTYPSSSEHNQRILPIPWNDETLLFCTNDNERDLLPFITFALQQFRKGQKAMQFYKQELHWKDAVILFNEWVMRSLTLNEALENITSGFVNYLPFERCALFSYSTTDQSGFGLFGYHLNNQAIQNIKEDINNVPLIHGILQKVQMAGMHAKNLQPILISDATKGLPNQYVQQFQLESIVIAPIFAPSEGQLIGAAILDQGPGKKFKLSRETFAALMKFGQIAGEILIKYDNDDSKAKTPTLRLSPREVEVLKLMAEGASTSEAAQELNLSEYTVRDYISAILQKMDARNRTEAVVKAIREGII
jgi:DNA-binding CsgD family transcriptional regulator